jgi:hypothetical protein
MASFNNSPRIRLAPHSRLCSAISLMKATVSRDILGLRARTFDLRLQNRRYASRCQRRSVSGWMIKSACFQVRTALARSTRRIRSVFVQVGRFTCRLSMISCCRKSAFSAKSSDLLLARSTSVPSGEESVSGLVQSTKRTRSTSKKLPTSSQYRVMKPLWSTLARRVSTMSFPRYFPTPFSESL